MILYAQNVLSPAVATVQNCMFECRGLEFIPSLEMWKLTFSVRTQFKSEDKIFSAGAHACEHYYSSSELVSNRFSVL